MKRLYTFGIIILSFISLAGCKDLKEFSESPEATIVITATHEGALPDTKSVRMDDGSSWWNPKEEISVFYGSGSNGGSKFISTNTSLAETTEFEGSISMSGNKNFWAVYPYSAENSCDGSSITTVIPSRQTGVEGNFSDDAFPAMGRSSSLTMPFWNICGGIKFSVSRSDIESISFRGNNGETLAGRIKVAFNADGHPEVVEVIEGVKEVSLSAPDGGTFKPGKYYYMTLLPAVLDNGFSISFLTEKEVGTFQSDLSQCIKRSVFGTLNNIDSKVAEWSSNNPIPEPVDLGLSVRWAPCNIGATKPEDYGDYFAWGETNPKSKYSVTNYLWCNSFSFTKYCFDSDSGYNGFTDDKTILDIEDDAAYANWGEKWRTPSIDECKELINNCKWSSTTINGINGLLATGKNGNTLFFPASGYMVDDTINAAGNVGVFLSSSLDADTPWSVADMRFDFNHASASNSASSRTSGLTVRPVYIDDDVSIPASDIVLNKQALTLTLGYDYQLCATITPSNASDIVISWTSNNDLIATVNSDGLVSTHSIGCATISAHTSNGLSATCDIKVEAPKIPNAVDLGLSVKWASFNVGASRASEYGDIFAWGETKPKEKYSWGTYKWCEGTAYSVTKYNKVDNKTVLDIEDDAAHVILGGNWCMPTAKQVEELIINCSWNWTYVNGALGYKITSEIPGYTNNWIFLPAEQGEDHYCYGSIWSSTLDVRSSSPLSLTFNNNTARYFLSGDSRYLGRSIRAVDATISSILLNETALTMTIGNAHQLVATITPANAIDKNIKWSTDNTSIANVSSDGIVTAISVGTTTITAQTTNGLIAQCVITVEAPKSPKAVDLGLSVKWATFNVGANKPEEYGDYFAWGETEPFYREGYAQIEGAEWKTGKSEGYTWSSYKWCNDSFRSLIKYNEESWHGTVDNKTCLDIDDDAAHVRWGGNWRMPTQAEQDELHNTSNCSWTWTTLNGIEGYKVTSKKDGFTDNWIFLPAAGYRYGTDLDVTNSNGYYWSSSLGTMSTSAQSLIFYYGSGSSDRCEGLSIRPVYDDSIETSIPVSSIKLSESSLTLTIGDIHQLVATVLPTNASNRVVTWSSDNASVANVNQSGRVTALKEGSTTIHAYSSNGLEASCRVTVLAAEEPDNDEYVDLGLSVKWATCNVGASQPWEYGHYFSWGETITKSYYSYSTYSYYNNSTSSYTKYFSDGQGNSVLLSLDDDAAHVNLGNNWRMPTYDEMWELYISCSWEWTTLNGVYGERVTSMKEGYEGKSIFLPAAGYKYDALSIEVGTYGTYWTSSLCTDYEQSDYAKYLNFNSNLSLVSIVDRVGGRTIRPVRGK